MLLTKAQKLVNLTVIAQPFCKLHVLPRKGLIDLSRSTQHSWHRVQQRSSYRSARLNSTGVLTCIAQPICELHILPRKGLIDLSRSAEHSWHRAEQRSSRCPAMSWAGLLQKGYSRWQGVWVRGQAGSVLQV